MVSRNMVLATTFVALSLTVSEALGVRLCGKQLADMLDLVCDGRGFHWSPRTGSVPQIRKRNAVQYLLTTPLPPVTEVGIVTECCRKACSIADMESYCAAAPGTYVVKPTNGPLTRELANEIINSGLRTEYPQTAPATPVPLTTPSPNRSVRPGPRLLAPFGGSSRVRPHGSHRTSGLLSSNIFFFVRPVGPRPTRTPVVS